MAETSLDMLLKGSSGRSTRGLLRITILLTIAAAAVASRLFSVIRMCELNWLLDFLLIQFQDSKVLSTNVRSSPWRFLQSIRRLRRTSRIDDIDTLLYS